MKTLLTTILMLACSIVLSSAQKKGNPDISRDKSFTMTGYLVDQMCAKRMAMDDVKKSDAKASRHTKECALDENCSKNGYCLVTGGKVYQLDASGDIQAKEYLKSTSKENDIKVMIAGTLENGILNVRSIKDFHAPSAKQVRKK